MLLKYCRCGRIIPQGMDRCPACEARKISRHTKYNQQIRDPKAMAFYSGKEWKAARAIIIPIFDGIDIWAYLIDKEIKPAEEVHHIVELMDDWDRRLDYLNLFPLAHDTHTRITALYKHSKASMIQTQKRLLQIRSIYFESRGGIEKVLQAAGLVAPLFSLEKNPH